MAKQEPRSVVADAMKRRKLTQTELAEQIGAHRGAVNRTLGNNLFDPRSLWIRIFDTLGLEAVIKPKDRLPDHALLLPFFVRMELENHSVTEEDLAKEFNINSIAAVKMLSSLESDDCLTSHVQKAKDKEAKIIVWALTPYGKSVALELTSQMKEDSEKEYAPTTAILKFFPSRKRRTS